jgi:uncharacterized protein (TIGR03437 family)
MMLANSVGSNLVIAINTGTGSFMQAFSYPINVGMNVKTADLNGDGILDLVVGGGAIQTAGLAVNSLQIMTGVGDGSFKTGNQYSFNPSNSIVFDFTLSDIRGSGRPDIVEAVWAQVGSGLANEITYLLVLPSNGDGTFQNAVQVANLGNTALFALGVADFDNDGRLDVAFPTTSMSAIAAVGSVNPTTDPSGVATALAALPVGGGEILLNNTPPLSFTDANDASFKAGPQAQDAILAAFGGGLSSKTDSSLALPTTLAGVNVNVKDSAGTTRAAPLFYVSPKQVNYTVPAGTALGAAMISIVNGATAAVATQQIVPVAPGIFAVNGIAAANVASYLPGAAQPTVTSPFQLSNGAIALAPVVLDPKAQVYLFLYGTGIRHAVDVTANLGSLKNQAVEYAGAQGFYVGEDQINVLLPQSLKGAGVINITLTADGFTTNAVQIEIQ